MAPVDPTTTIRLKVHYTGPLGSHHMLFHGEVDQTAVDLVGDVADFVDLVSVLQFQGTVWDTAELAEAGSALFFPTSIWDTITGASGINPSGGSSPSAFFQIGGRDSTAGTRVKLYVFETFVTPNATMRISAGANASVDAIITELASIDNTISNIAGRVPEWYTYVNVGENDHLTHKART